MTSWINRALVTGAGVVVGLGMAMTTATAAPAGGGTVHGSDSLVGAVFTCAAGDLTVQSGTIDFVDHFNIDARGYAHGFVSYHPSDVVLTDEAGGVYTLSGAGSFGAMFSGPDQPVLIKDVQHTVVHGPNGIHGKIQLSFHVKQDGTVSVADRGTCAFPPGLLG